jgi:acyl carrier protein
MKRVLDAIREVFPDFREEDYAAESKLDSIPGWDSMNSINLQLELESSFGMDMGGAPLSGEDTIGMLVSYIEKESA